MHQKIRREISAGVFKAIFDLRPHLVVDILNFVSFVTRVTDMDATVKGVILDFGHNRPVLENLQTPLTPIWGILGTELASFLDKKSRVTFSVLMTSYLTENFLFHNNFKLR